MSTYITMVMAAIPFSPTYLNMVQLNISVVIPVTRAVASMVEMAVTKEMIGADKLIADKAFVPIRLETNKPSTIV